MILPQGSTMTWPCGLYRIENGLPAFLILTREEGEGIRFIHDRMPLIMPWDYADDWIKPGTKPEKLVRLSLTEMKYEKVAGQV